VFQASPGSSSPEPSSPDSGSIRIGRIRNVAEEDLTEIPMLPPRNNMGSLALLGLPPLSWISACQMFPLPRPGKAYGREHERQDDKDGYDFLVSLIYKTHDGIIILSLLVKQSAFHIAFKFPNLPDTCRGRRVAESGCEVRLPLS